MLMCTKCNSPEFIVDLFESTLFFWKRSSSKDWLKIDPFTLDLVQILQNKVEIGETCLPDGCLVLKMLVIRWVFQWLQQRLIVANLLQTHNASGRNNSSKLPEKHLHMGSYQTAKINKTNADRCAKLYLLRFLVFWYKQHKQTLWIF